MAAAGIAAQFGEDGDDFIFEIDRQVFGAAGCCERDCGLPTGGFGGRDGGHTVLNGDDEPFLIDGHDFRFVDRPGDGVCQVMPLSTGIDAGDQQLAACVLSDKHSGASLFELDRDEVEGGTEARWQWSGRQIEGDEADTQQRCQSEDDEPHWMSPVERGPRKTDNKV